MAEHTPGPWAYHPETGEIRMAGPYPEHLDLAVVPKWAAWAERGMNVHLGNGTLMAAAPDLLAALEQHQAESSQQGRVLGCLRSRVRAA